MKKKQRREKDSLEEFQAYGEYNYAYRHQQQDEIEPEAEQAPAEERKIAPAAERTRARSRSITGRLIFLLVVCILTVVVLQGTVFRLKTVCVVGNRNRTPQQIAAASGLVKDLNIFAISEEQVRDNLSSDHTIVFLGMQKVYPSTIYLYVDEREEVATLQWLGMQYTLDDEGVVMSESNDLVLPDNMPVVTGIQVNHVQVGEKLTAKNSEQIQAYCDIMYELDQQMFSNQILELNLADADNLYLVTADGISVRLGDRSSMRAKIGAVRTDLTYLRQLGKNSGLLDVSIPEDAKYTPES